MSYSSLVVRYGCFESSIEGEHGRGFESSGTVTSDGAGMFSGERCNYWLPIVWVNVRWNLKYLERISGTVSFSDRFDNKIKKNAIPKKFEGTNE